jgi:3-hexulose-6-phosphate synthase/6-phospho-3-hexuloisomerase
MRVTAQRLMRPGTAALSDGMHKGGAMQHDMQCRSAKASMAGPAFTVRVHSADILMVTPALKECPKGHVLVIDGRGDLNTALWGELTTYSAQGKGLAGVVIDGALRDARQIRKCAFPVFARAVVPNAGGAEYLGEINVTVNCAGQVVRPGDWVVGDEDGVIVIPAETAEAVLTTAERIVAAEKKIERYVRAGAELADLIGVQAAIEQKRAGVFIPQLRGGK